MSKINWLEIQGFRSFGKIAQRFDFGTEVAVIWGPNSNGKTTIAEAVEFILTGGISRRDLIASSLDEFASSLRNVFVPPDIPVYVAIELSMNNGEVYHIKRTLLSDYGKKGTCESLLEINAVAANQDDLEALGFNMHMPPMATPILMQHALTYLFSAKPQDRATYFKSLLEVNDLETLRNDLYAVISGVVEPKTELVSKLDYLISLDKFKALKQIFNDDFDKKSLQDLFSAVINVLLSVNINNFAESITILEDRLESQLLKVFPLDLFSRQSISEWQPDFLENYENINNQVVIAESLDEMSMILVPMYKEIIKYMDLMNLDPADCPACLTPSALTNARIAKIKEILISNEDAVSASENVKALIQNLEKLIIIINDKAIRAIPKFLSTSSRGRKEQGFLISAIRILLTDQKIIDEWLKAVKLFLKAYKNFKIEIAKVQSIINSLKQHVSVEDLFEKINLIQNDIRKALAEFKSEEGNYSIKTTSVYNSLTEVVNNKANTVGWQELLTICKNMIQFSDELDQAKRKMSKLKKLETALKQIEVAKDNVLNDKFNDLSNEVKLWWGLLRPEEKTFFESLMPRENTKRTIDFTAGMISDESRTKIEFRNVVAVFSQSQMCCLGLASFLARSVRDKNFIIILDDPILSSDEDHRAYFVSTVIEKLIELGIQVIILTQDQGTWVNIENLYAHLDVSVFQISMDSILEGTQVENKGDNIFAQLTRIQVYVKTNNPQILKTGAEKLRDAAERFCKELIVKNMRSQGNNNVTITDYNGKTLEQLEPLVMPYLNDPSHLGKLRQMRKVLNPGNHDGHVPNKGDLGISYGNLKDFAKFYLKDE